MDEGINRLARVFEKRTKELCDKPPQLDFGTIQADMSLLTDYFPVPVPQSDYMVCRSVQWGAVENIFYRTQDPGRENSGRRGHGHNN